MVIENKYFSKNELVTVLEKNGVETGPIMVGNMVQQSTSKLFSHRISGKLKNSEYIIKKFVFDWESSRHKQKIRKYVVDVISQFIDMKIKK